MQLRIININIYRSLISYMRYDLLFLDVCDVRQGPHLQELHFSCSRCGSCVAVATTEGRFEYPAFCPKKCRFARFTVEKEKCKAIDWQRIRLQEDFAELSGAGPQRRMPRTVDCDLKRGLATW